MPFVNIGINSSRMPKGENGDYALSTQQYLEDTNLEHSLGQRFLPSINRMENIS